MMSKRKYVTGKLRVSLIVSAAKMWSNHDWEKNRTRETTRYRLKFRFDNDGPHFMVTDLKTYKEYYVEAYSNSDFLVWTAYENED